MDASMESLLSSVKAPINNEKVYKEECMFSFDTPVGACGTREFMCKNYWTANMISIANKALFKVYSLNFNLSFIQFNILYNIY